MNNISWRSVWMKVSSALTALFIAAGSLGASPAQSTALMPIPGTMVALSENFVPCLLQGVKMFPNNPLRLEFYINACNPTASIDQVKLESVRLIKYFLASLTVPEKDLWVNLSPYEKDRIVPEAFGQTEMGRDLLAQDYILKQITASVIYPEEEVGKEFWEKVYAEALKRYGTTDVPVDTFNKVWIIPEKATVYENKSAAYVVESHLKVMLDVDYTATARTAFVSSSDDVSRLVMREVIVPILEKEVNEGRNFSALRQIYNSLILATWYKRKVKATIMGRAYVDQKKTVGIDIVDKSEKAKIWQLYVEAFQKGAFNIIKEEYDPASETIIPRKYYSGGMEMRLGDAYGVKKYEGAPAHGGQLDHAMTVEVNLNVLTDSAMVEPQDSVKFGPEKWISREADVLDGAYNVIDDLKATADKPVKMLLIGVGRGMTAIELALKFHNLTITAINKQEGMWDENVITQAMIQKGYAEKEIVDARGRIQVHIMDVDMIEADMVPDQEKYEYVFFETRVQIFLKDQVKAIQTIFNKFVRAGGVYGFAVNNIFTAMDSEKRLPEAKATSIVVSSFRSLAVVTNNQMVDGYQYIKVRRVSNDPVMIPLTLEGIDLGNNVNGYPQDFVFSYYHENSAMSAEAFNKGGIDLNSMDIHLNVRNNNQESELAFDSAMFQRFQNASGVAPVIVRISSLCSIQEFMEVQK